MSRARLRVPSCGASLQGFPATPYQERPALTQISTQLADDRGHRHSRGEQARLSAFRRQQAPGPAVRPRPCRAPSPHPWRGPREGRVPRAAWRGVAHGTPPESRLLLSPPPSVPSPEAQLRPLSASAAARLGTQGRSSGPRAGGRRRGQSTQQPDTARHSCLHSAAGLDQVIQVICPLGI